MKTRFSLKEFEAILRRAQETLSSNPNGKKPNERAWSPTSEQLKSTPLRFAKDFELRDAWDAYLFDVFCLARNPIGGRFLRHCLPFELPPGKFKELSDGEKSVVLCVNQSEPGLLQKDVFVCSGRESLERRIRSKAVGLIGQIINPDGDLLTGYFRDEKLVYQTTTPARKDSVSIFEL
jgi:hypothetical protein